MTVQAESPFDVAAFRRALGHFPTGVCVVSCAVNDERLGMTMSSFNSLSLEPPLVLFSVDRRAASLATLKRAQSFAINILSENQRDISNRFSKPRSNKWEGMTFGHNRSGDPVLPGVAAVFDCKPWATHDAGDHVLFIAMVERFICFEDRQPLVFAKGRYAALQPTEYAAPLWPLDIHY
jgi:flavin reductase (DIM6/NTAB) family NADH-FMN oxidoreductase RutF